MTSCKYHKYTVLLQYEYDYVPSSSIFEKTSCYTFHTQMASLQYVIDNVY
jgi:hypothetical protein